MAAVFSPDIIARVKDETDIVEIVRQHVSLKQAGAVYKGLCPFHKEKTPSFIVTPARDRYHCFGCGGGGDVISFLMEIEGVSFPEAVEILARPLDIDLSEWLKEDENEGERRSFHRANETASTIWQEALWEQSLGRAARQYILGRGFTEKVLKDHSVGWAPAGSSWLQPRLEKGGVDLDLAMRADLLRRKDQGTPFAYFRSRIIFPIKNISRQVVGFGGRVVDQGEPKYLNSADNSYFTKGRLLYGFDVSRMAISRQKTAILVEGYLDLLALAQVGFSNVVATCGTAFTTDQARLIRRGAPQVILVFDGDKAGLKAAVRSADVALRNGLEPRIVRLPQGSDPADLVMAGGAEAVSAQLDEAQGYVPFLKGLAAGRGSDREVHERALRQVLGTVAGIQDPLRREYVLQEASDVFGVGLEILRATVAEELTRQSRRKPVASATGTTGPADTAEPVASAGMAEREPKLGPVVRRSLAQVNARSIEVDMLAHILRDDSGHAARIFLKEQDGLELSQPEARLIAGEITAWDQRGGQQGEGTSPREFILGRWNTAGDGEYRSFVSRLINTEGLPADTDFGQVTRDCLARLKQNRKASQG